MDWPVNHVYSGPCGKTIPQWDLCLGNPLKDAGNWRKFNEIKGYRFNGHSWLINYGTDFDVFDFSAGFIPPGMNER
jgi:hypothetical protein